jgi:hypothetical protein
MYFPRVFDEICRCFNCFGRMLQVFYLNVTKVDLMLHILQLDPSAVIACYSSWACPHVRGCGGGTGDMRGKPCERRSRCDPCMGARRRGKRSCAGPHVKLAQAWGLAQQLACLCMGAGRRSRRGRLDASACSDVQVLALPFEREKSVYIGTSRFVFVFESNMLNSAIRIYI